MFIVHACLIDQFQILDTFLKLSKFKILKTQTYLDVFRLINKLDRFIICLWFEMSKLN